MTRAANGEGSLLVIGIGNPDRGDDGIGPLVVRQLAGMVPPGVTIIERPGDALALIDDWAGHDAVILVDAAAPGRTPGSVHRIDLLADTLSPGLWLSSTHAFGVAEAVGLAHTLGLLPAHVIAYAIEGANFDPGAPVSPIVAAAAGEVAMRVADELRRLADGHQPHPPAATRHGPDEAFHPPRHHVGADGSAVPGHDEGTWGQDGNHK